MSLFIIVLLPMLAGVLTPVLRLSPRRRRVYLVAATCAVSAAALLVLWRSRNAPPQVLLRLNDALVFALQVDGLALLFGGMVCLLWPLACLYATEYMSREGEEERFFAFYLIAFGVTLGIALSANLLTMYLFYELLTLVTLPLVMHSMDSKARYAGRVYLVYSMCGAALGFVSMVFLLQNGGTMFRFGGALTGVSQGSELLLIAYLLGFFGFGVKAAVFPGHKWLLRASVAPTPVTALLHAVAVVKAGVFAVVRLTWYGFGPALLAGTWAQTLAMAAAVFTIVYGSAQALRTNHLKRRLAWSTVSNLSYILLGVVSMTTAGLLAGLVHMLFHAVLKITLFFGVGAVHYQTHRDFLPDIEGCGRLMPVVFTTFTVASLGLMGVPPLAGFSSKWLLAAACTALGTVLGDLGAVALIVSAILTALYLLQIVVLGFFPRQHRILSVRLPKAVRCDPSWAMTLPLCVLALASILLGLFANDVLELVAALLLD